MFKSIANSGAIFSKRIILSIVVLSALGFFTFGGAGLFAVEQKTCAGPCQIVQHFYYSDATMTTLVGAKIFGCNGTNQWGIVTEFEDVQEAGCCPSCPDC